MDTSSSNSDKDESKYENLYVKDSKGIIANNSLKNNYKYCKSTSCVESKRSRITKSFLKTNTSTITSDNENINYNNPLSGNLLTNKYFIEKLPNKEFDILNTQFKTVKNLKDITDFSHSNKYTNIENDKLKENQRQNRKFRTNLNTVNKINFNSFNVVDNKKDYNNFLIKRNLESNKAKLIKNNNNNNNYIQD